CFCGWAAGLRRSTAAERDYDQHHEFSDFLFPGICFPYYPSPAAARTRVCSGDGSRGWSSTSASCRARQGSGGITRAVALRNVIDCSFIPHSQLKLLDASPPTPDSGVPQVL